MLKFGYGLALAGAVLMMTSQLQAAELKVMTFNVRYGTANDGENHWKVRRARTLKVLRTLKPSLIGVQEALDFQVTEMSAALSGYQSVGVGRDDGKVAGEFSAILFDPKRLRLLKSSTFWLSDTPEVVASKHWGNRIVRICTWAYFQDRETGKFFYHFNAHLDHESQPSRVKSIALMLARIAQRGTNDPVVITGDFNVGEENPVVSQVTNAGFDDTYRVAHPSEKNVGTFNGWQPEAGPDKIDYIFVGRGANVKDAKIVKSKVDNHWISDHFPVTATIDFG